MVNEEAKFDYLKETVIERIVKTLASIALMLYIISLIIKLFSKKLDFIILIFIIMFVVIIVLIFKLIILMNSQYKVVFYKDFIKLNDIILKNSEIKFIGIVVTQGGPYSTSNFEVHSVNNIFILRYSKKCRIYFKKYCSDKNINNNL